MNKQELRQIYNPFLPLNEYIPDGEPHVFGDRVYLFGSHDKEGGESFCMLDYTVYSAPVTDLTDWRCEGTIYQAKQDPDGTPYRRYITFDPGVMNDDGIIRLYYGWSLAAGTLTVRADETPVAELAMKATAEWCEVSIPIQVSGTHGLYLYYTGTGYFDLESIFFESRT